jgi:SWI/SNF-related matrix-associated actin-dependent regulator 1 of chromatin subfamily A
VIHILCASFGYFHQNQHQTNIAPPTSFIKLDCFIPSFIGHLVRPMATKTRGRSPPTAGASLPSKRRKLSYDSENDSGDEFFAGLTETEQLPLDESVPTQRLPIPLTPSKNIGGSDATIPTQLLDIVSASPLATSQPTQILPRPSDYTPTLTSPPVVQVQASSPVLSTLSSPAKPSSGAARTSSFFPQKLNVKVVDLSSQSPQYIGSSSEGETSDYDIKPMFSNTTKKPIPAASSLRSRKENSISQTEERVPQTPIISMNTLAARFGYNPTPKVGRLDSLTRKSRPTSTYGSATQRKPEPATLTLDITLSEIESFEKRSAVSRMKSVLPNKPLRELLSMLEKCRGNYDDAMDKLTQHENFIDLTSDEPRYIKTANRGVGAGRMAIKDKWSTTQATKRDDSTPTTAGTKRRRLVRGSNRNSRERSESPQAPITIDDDSDDSAIHEDDDSEDERNLERKVLSYVNKCSGTELADIACTTDEIAMAIIAKRPFSNIDDVREVTVDTSTTSTTTDGKKKRGKRFKAIGDKVIDICLETWRGYEAVDLLITKVEALGRPIAASIKSWGVDVQTGTGSGELKMTDINVGSDSGSAKDSGIGTPIDDDDAAVKGAKRIKPTTFKEQPKNMREGVQLKDYQLAGLNWLNLLYEKKLSCILADEMGMIFLYKCILNLQH